MMVDLFRENDRKMIGKFIKSEQDRLSYNSDIFKILEGNLKDLLEERMKTDLGNKSFEQAKTRIAPINVFKKIVAKQTAIYNQPVIRTVEGGNEKDAELLRWYEKTLNLNMRMSRNNYFFNAFLYSLLQITLTDVDPVSMMGRPFIRTVPNHQFLVMSTSETNPTSPDVVILCMDPVINEKGEPEECYYVHTNRQFVIMDAEGKIHVGEMNRMGVEGVNPYGTTPFIYNNYSENLAMPMIQADNKEMALLIALLLTDLNYAVKFQAFSMFVGIDIDDSKVEISPNSIMYLKSDGSGNSPSFSAVKPTIDITETLSLASSQMSLWLTSKGIRPGAVAQLGADQFSSGVSKMIEESDTYESVKEQIAIYEQAENAFWNKLLKQIHPFWVAGRRIENTTPFTMTAEVRVKFTQPKPMQSRGQLIDELTKEVQAGFTTLEQAVRKLNPEMDEAAVNAMIEEAKAELAMKAPRPLQNDENQFMAS